MLFVFSDVDHQAAKKLVQHAQTFVVTYQDMHRVKSGLDQPFHKDPARCVVIADMFHCLLLYEQHPNGMYRHIAVGYARGPLYSGNPAPPPTLVAYLARELFGFRVADNLGVDAVASFVDDATPCALHIVQQIHEDEEA
jgi:hypothetical protein